MTSRTAAATLAASNKRCAIGGGYDVECMEYADGQWALFVTGTRGLIDQPHTGFDVAHKAWAFAANAARVKGKLRCQMEAEALIAEAATTECPKEKAEYLKEAARYAAKANAINV